MTSQFPQVLAGRYEIRDLIRTAMRRCAEAKQERIQPGRFIISKES